MTQTKSRNRAKIESGSDPIAEVIVMLPNGQGGSGKMGIRALINMCATGMLTIKQWMSPKLRHGLLMQVQSSP